MSDTNSMMNRRNFAKDSTLMQHLIAAIVMYSRLIFTRSELRTAAQSCKKADKDERFEFCDAKIVKNYACFTYTAKNEAHAREIVSALDTSKDFSRDAMKVLQDSRSKLHTLMRLNAFRTYLNTLTAERVQELVSNTNAYLTASVSAADISRFMFSLESDATIANVEATSSESNVSAESQTTIDATNVDQKLIESTSNVDSVSDTAIANVDSVSAESEVKTATSKKQKKAAKKTNAAKTLAAIK